MLVATGFSELLKGGDPRSLGRIAEVIEAVLADRSRCRELFECLFSDDETVRMRAADGLEKVAARRPDMIEPFTPELLGPVAEIAQPSVQWHLAEILGEISLSAADRRRATRILKRNLESSEDWIVIGDTMQTLTGFAESDAGLRAWLLPALRRHRDSGRKAVAKRAQKCLTRLG
ncbi:MAG TPA: hypothetical protein VHB30_00335 [Solirubrobacteraceae bacterium]|nr:hypothetical protein [Solirubrobacteraceae bacterium]